MEGTILEVDLVVVYNGAQFQIFDGPHGLGNFPQTLGYAGKGWVDCITYPMALLLVTNRGTLTFGTYPKALQSKQLPPRIQVSRCIYENFADCRGRCT
jgi:hypothetical protein